MITACAASQNAKVKMDTAVVNGENKAISFAKQCVIICSQEARKMDVISHKKLNKCRVLKGFTKFNTSANLIAESQPVRPACNTIKPSS